jgi:phosphatidylserine/phosphatidylglycerophosphate/cardiolipin synthase-like enzyme
MAAPARGSEVYFSPDGGIRAQIIRRIDQSHHTIDIAVYSFTSQEIAEALVEAHHRGVRVRVIRDYQQTSNKRDEDNYLQSNGIDVKRLFGRPPHGVMHHKFAVFDDKVVETGSFNWTLNGERYSHENALFFDDPSLVRAFDKEFEKLWKEPAF